MPWLHRWNTTVMIDLWREVHVTVLMSAPPLDKLPGEVGEMPGTKHIRDVCIVRVCNRLGLLLK